MMERPDKAIDAWLEAWVRESTCSDEGLHDDEIECALGARQILAYIADLEAEVGRLHEELRLERLAKWKTLGDTDGHGAETWQAWATDLDMQRMELEAEVARLREALGIVSGYSREDGGD